MAAAHLVKVGEAWLPGISQYNVNLEDIDSDDTARSETGVMVRSVIRKKVKKLSFTCKVSDTQLAAICELLSGDTAEMTVFCPADDAATDKYITSTFYVSKMSMQMLKFANECYWTLTYNAVEV